jgi:hypothetical protein
VRHFTTGTGQGIVGGDYLSQNNRFGGFQRFLSNWMNY